MHYEINRTLVLTVSDVYDIALRCLKTGVLSVGYDGKKMVVSRDELCLRLREMDASAEDEMLTGNDEGEMELCLVVEMGANEEHSFSEWDLFIALENFLFESKKKFLPERQHVFPLRTAYALLDVSQGGYLPPSEKPLLIYDLGTDIQPVFI